MMKVDNWTGLEEIDDALERGETDGWFGSETDQIGGKWWINESGELEIKNTWYNIDYEKLEEVDDDDDEMV